MDAAACPARHEELPNDGQGEHQCFCAKDAITGNVWGSEIYTPDSSICAAAQHAGVITAEGGLVTARSVQGCPSYQGKEQHGITSANRDSSEASFYFPANGNGRCATTGPCPKNSKGLSSESLSCSCGSIDAKASVWGTDLYAADSNVCTAAVHAGVITTVGGPVIVKRGERCAKYRGSERNGVTSRDWKPLEQSFYFPEKADGKCP